MAINLIHRRLIQEVIANLVEENIDLRAQIILLEQNPFIPVSMEIPLEDPEGESSVGEAKS